MIEPAALALALYILETVKQQKIQAVCGICALAPLLKTGGTVRMSDCGPLCKNREKNYES